MITLLRTCDVLVTELDVEQIYARLVWLVLQSVLRRAGAFHLHVRTMRSFHGQTQTAMPCKHRNAVSIVQANFKKIYYNAPTGVPSIGGSVKEQPRYNSMAISPSAL